MQISNVHSHIPLLNHHTQIMVLINVMGHGTSTQQVFTIYTHVYAPLLIQQNRRQKQMHLIHGSH